MEKLERFDSTTFTLFSEVFKRAGHKPLEVKKGGIKAQTLLPFDSFVPEHIELGAAAKNDKDFLGKLPVKERDLYVFDKGIVNYKMNDKGVYLVTLLNKNTSYKVIRDESCGYFGLSHVWRSNKTELSIKQLFIG